jgi:hypothetical protein
MGIASEVGVRTSAYAVSDSRIVAEDGVDDIDGNPTLRRSDA